jgi:hypothetical protein
MRACGAAEFVRSSAGVHDRKRSDPDQMIQGSGQKHVPTRLPFGVVFVTMIARSIFAFQPGIFIYRLHTAYPRTCPHPDPKRAGGRLRATAQALRIPPRKGGEMAEGDEDIDLEQVVWDPRYRREVIERLNRQAADIPIEAGTDEAAARDGT